MEWVPRDPAYGEKLATPDISIADLIGEVDPIKVAEAATCRTSSTIHYGLLPRTNRGIFAINELPGFAERIQVGLSNIWRSATSRSAAQGAPTADLLWSPQPTPEDYTNHRGRIITPLKDRFGSQIRTHYPLKLAHGDRHRGAGGGRYRTLTGSSIQVAPTT